jgi:hypothetical protein
MAKVPKLAEGASSAAELEYPAPADAKGELAEVPKVMGQEKAESAKAPKHPAEAKEKTVVELELEESTGLPKIMSPPPEPELPKVSKIPAITPKRRRMASVLDAVMESTRVSTPASIEEKNIKEATKDITICVEAKVGPSVPAEIGPLKLLERKLNKDLWMPL